jgi:hypothetical protein
MNDLLAVLAVRASRRTAFTGQTRARCRCGAGGKGIGPGQLSD